MSSACPVNWGQCFCPHGYSTTTKYHPLSSICHYHTSNRNIPSYHALSTPSAAWHCWGKLCQVQCLFAGLHEEGFARRNGSSGSRPESFQIRSHHDGRPWLFCGSRSFRTPWLNHPTYTLQMRATTVKRTQIVLKHHFVRVQTEVRSHLQTVNPSKNMEFCHGKAAKVVKLRCAAGVFLGHLRPVCESRNEIRGGTPSDPWDPAWWSLSIQPSLCCVCTLCL